MDTEQERDQVVVPTACSLSASDARTRIMRWQTLREAHQIGATTSQADGLIVKYEPAPGVALEVSELAALERDCCPFLTLDVASSEDAVTLTVRPSSLADDDVASQLTTLTSLIAG